LYEKACKWSGAASRLSFLLCSPADPFPGVPTTLVHSVNCTLHRVVPAWLRMGRTRCLGVAFRSPGLFGRSPHPTCSDPNGWYSKRDRFADGPRHRVPPSSFPLDPSSHPMSTSAPCFLSVATGTTSSCFPCLFLLLSGFRSSMAKTRVTRRMTS